MKSLSFVLIVAVVFFVETVPAATIYVLHDATVPQAAYAARKVSKAVQVQGHQVLPQRQGYDFMISLALNPSRLGPEAFAIIPEGKVITVYGGDDRGLIYGALALAEDLANGTPLTAITASNSICRGTPTAPAQRSISTSRPSRT